MAARARVGGRHGGSQEVGVKPERQVLVVGDARQQGDRRRPVGGGERREVPAAHVVVGQRGEREVDQDTVPWQVEQALGCSAELRRRAATRHPGTPTGALPTAAVPVRPAW
jgi:hypothetical protein